MVDDDLINQKIIYNILENQLNITLNLIAKKS